VLRIIFIPRLTALKKTDVSRGIHLIRKTNPVINTRERGAYFSTWTTTTVLRMEFVRGDNSVRVLNTGNYSIQTNTRTNIEIISETPLCLSDVLLLYISKSFCFWNTFCGLKWLPEILNDTCHSQRNMFLLPVSNTIYQDREWRKKTNICEGMPILMYNNQVLYCSGICIFPFLKTADGKHQLLCYWHNRNS
jgi:hypothetical protein